ncbi:hypothetical protein AB0F77_22145 [Streptomyces sp. NPDC026672]|uniref:beta family protein n=1 Tax=unclassified Streptomyces TaxID=2593676 RepID=UPI0033C583FD
MLDVGAVEDTTEAGKKAVVALDALGTLLPWRTVILTSGAFPRTRDDPGTGSVHGAPRYDRLLHQAVREARPEFPRALVYGDYSVEHAFSAGIPQVPPPRPRWGLLRYTTPDAFVMARVPTGGPDRADRVRATARTITRSDTFRGPDYSEGERWLTECAEGEGSKGSGNAEWWIRAGHAQHLSFAVHELLTGRRATRGG